jgi:hypothetical protein
MCRKSTLIRTMTSSESDDVATATQQTQSDSPTIDARLDIASDRFDAAYALAHASHVPLPVRVKPFDHLDRCRFLLPPDDSSHLPPPRRSADRTVNAVAPVAAVAVAPPDPNRISVSNTLHDMMAPLVHGRFALLSDLRARRASATVTMRPVASNPVTRLYIGTLELYDRRGNVVLVDAREEPGSRPVPHVLLCGAHILSVTRTASS